MLWINVEFLKRFVFIEIKFKQKYYKSILGLEKKNHLALDWVEEI